MASSQNPGILGRNPGILSPRSPGLLGRNDAADPDLRGLRGLGDTPGLLGRGDWADPAFASSHALAAATFDITEIPGIMRRNKWLNGARLMEQWFERAAKTAPDYSTPETDTIKMDSWVLKFDRAKLVYDEILREKIWLRPKAKELLIERMKQKKLWGGSVVHFGDLSKPVLEIDKNFINERYVKSSGWSADDMYSALGAFNLRVAIEMAAIRRGDGYQVEVREVGVYVRDSYDFNDDESAWLSQTLGFWGWGNYVTNSDFRKWRSKHERGGDFLVYSDIKRERLNPPDTFELR